MRNPRCTYSKLERETYLEVNGEVEEVIQILEVRIKGLQQQLLVVLVRNIADHESRPHIFASLYSTDIQHVLHLLFRFRVLLLFHLRRNLLLIDVCLVA